MIGFAPGFPYLGGLAPEIATPRKEKPRPRVPAGSVGIGGKQTGVYPIPGPGGWQLIGQTPLMLFNPHHDQPSLLQAGDLIRFVAISEKQFEQKKEVAGGT
jgi:inhibitor of KinA